MEAVKYFSDSVLYSYGQIFFSNRRWFGAVVLIASMVHIQIGMMALAGVLIANLCAHLLKFEGEKIRTGFYGFNGLLFGAASVYYFDVSFYLLLIIPFFILITFLISSVIEHYFASAFNLPGLSLPFIITLFIFFYFLTNGQVIQPAMHSGEAGIVLPTPLALYLQSISIIILQPGLLAGAILAAGLLFFSRILFMLSIASTFFAYYVTGFIIPNADSSMYLLIGFNSILTSMALGGSLIIPSRKTFLLAMLAVILNIVLTGFFVQFLKGSQLPILVLPFNFITLTTIYSLKFRKEHSDLTLLYFAPGSPEENFYYHRNRVARFKDYKPLYAELPVFGEWFISQGFNGQHTHKEDWKYAWDFVVADDKKEQYDNDGHELSDYYCFKLPVVSPLDGEVVKVVDGIPNNRTGDVDLQKNWGNTIIINHGEGLFSALSHLESGSIKVKEGERVPKGEIIAQCGNSGRSPYPHIHFQFQLTDELGAHTYKFPIVHYIEKLNNELKLHTFGFPEQDSVIINLETHRTLKQAFEFKFESAYEWHCKTPKKEFNEKWEVKVTPFNSIYIESSRGSRITIFSTPKVSYLTDFSGNKISALYYLYLLAPMVPLSYHKDLTWKDTFSPALFPTGFIRYIAEFLMLFTEPLAVNGDYRFEQNPESNQDFLIKARIALEGKQPFTFAKSELTGNLAISKEGKISGFSVANELSEIFIAESIS